MKLCVTAQGNSSDSLVDLHFGRCQYFVFIEVEPENIEILQNPYVNGSGGVGIQAGQLMVKKEVNAVLTGNVGPNVFDILKAANIDVIVNVACSVKEAIENFKNGKYKTVDSPSVGKNSGKF